MCCFQLSGPCGCMFHLIWDTWTRRDHRWVCPFLCDLWLPWCLGGMPGHQRWGHGCLWGSLQLQWCDCVDCGVRETAMKVWSGCGCEEVVLLYPHKKWDELLCGWCGRTAVKELRALWLVGLSVGFRWPISTWLRIEVIEAEDVADIVATTTICFDIEHVQWN